MRSEQRGTQRLAGLRRGTPAALIFLLLLQPHVTAVLHAQETKVILKENLLKSLADREKIKGDRLSPLERIKLRIKLIREHGVDFRLTPHDEREIRKAGDYLDDASLNKLIAAVNDSYRPKTSLSGVIQQIEVTQSDDGRVNVFIRLLVRNDGTDTVAQQYRLRILHATSRNIDFKGRAVGLNEDLTLHQEDGSGQVVIRRQDALDRRTGQAIAKGRSVGGWLRFVLPPHPQFTPDFLRQPGIWFVVSFADVESRPYEAVFIR